MAPAGEESGVAAAPSSPVTAAIHTPASTAKAHARKPMMTRRTRAGTPRRLGLDQPALDRVPDQLDAVAHPELAQDVRAMRLDGLLGQVQRLGDRAVRVRLGDQLEDLLLARGQRLVRAGGGVGHPVADERALDGV